MKTFILSLLAATFQCLVSFPAFAQTELTYDCEIIVISEDIPDGSKTWTFIAPEDAGSHGGESTTYSQGAHQVEIMADAQWMALAWSKGGVLLARGLFALNKLDRTRARVAILSDPTSSTGAQVSLGCTESPLP